jgi:hypothetical protein
MEKNPYLLHIKKNLPRLLALFDSDKTSESYGMGDRLYWAWGLTDFANGVFQGAANGLSRLWQNRLWPYNTLDKNFFTRIDSMFSILEKMIGKDGSIDQAFPNEGSYAGTAFVAYDMLCTIQNFDEIDVLQNKRSCWLEIIKPMIAFLIKSDETHGMISNHLATAVAALLRWSLLTGESAAEEKARLLLERILDHQSEEGWFQEYQGADPGYQSLCMYYLAEIHRLKPEFNLLEPLTRATKFLWFFAHPDGSFGGHYGSRYTRFFNPAGIEALADEIPEAAALAEFMRESISKNLVVTLSAIDETNLIPWFNSYCLAAVLFEKKRKSLVNLSVPCRRNETFRICFKKAGLVVDKGVEHYTVISTHKGGIVYHFVGRKLMKCDTGIIIQDKTGNFASNQGYEPDNNVSFVEDNITIRSRFSAMPRRLPKPHEFMVLRFCEADFGQTFNYQKGCLARKKHEKHNSG